MINRLQRIIPKLRTPRPRVVAGIVLVLCNRIMDPVSSGGLFVSADPVPPYYHGPSTQPVVVAEAGSRLPAPIDEPWLPAFATFDSSRHHPHLTGPTPLLPVPSVGSPNVGSSAVVGDPQTSSIPTLPSVVPPAVVSQAPVGEPASYPIVGAPQGTPYFPAVGSSPNPTSLPPLNDALPPHYVGNSPSVGSSPVVSTFPDNGSSPVVNQSPSVGDPLPPPVVRTPVVSTSQPISAPEPTGLFWLAAGLPLLRRNRSNRA